MKRILLSKLLLALIYFIHIWMVSSLLLNSHSDWAIYYCDKKKYTHFFYGRYDFDMIVEEATDCYASKLWSGVCWCCILCLSSNLFEKMLKKVNSLQSDFTIKKIVDNRSTFYRWPRIQFWWLNQADRQEESFYLRLC